MKDQALGDWEPEIELSTDLASESQGTPSIAVEGDEVHVVWHGDDDGDFDIYYRYFNGTSWEPEQIISTDISMEDQARPNIAIDNGNIHVVWGDFGDGDWDVYYRHFNGTSWEPELEISTDIGTENQSQPTVAAENGEVHVVWGDEGDGDEDIYYRYFNGTAWQSELEISSDTGSEAQHLPSIAVENDEVHIVWMDYGNSNWDAYYRHYNGSEWQPEQKISTDNIYLHQRGPQIAVENGELHVVWSESDLSSGGLADIIYRHYDGLSWQTEVPIYANLNTSHSPVIDVENGRAYVAWMTRAAGPDYDIYYRFFNGTAWEPELEISSDIADERQDEPSIAVENGVVHVVWGDKEDGDWSVYYRRFLPADLEVTVDRLVLDPPGPIPRGTSVTVNATIHNIGWANASSVLVRFYDGDPGDPIGSGPGVQIGADQFIPLIKIGENESVEVIWTSALPKFHKIFVVVDPLDTIAEYNESNNIVNRTIEILAPDYILWNPSTSPQKVSVGNLVNISSQVKNIGDYNASVWSIVAFYNQSTPLSPFETHTVSPLNISEISQEFNAIWDAPLTAGIYYVTIEVDYDSDIDELNEDNNTYTIEFNVTGKPETTINIGTPQYGGIPMYVNSSTQFWFSVTDYSETGYNTYYYIDNPPFGPYTGPFTLATEGMHVIYFNSTDNLGGVEDTQSFTVIVDNTQPDTDAAVTGGPSYGNIDNDEINVTDTTQFTLTGNDNSGVGVDFEWWYITDLDNYSEVNPFTLASLSLDDGTYTLYYGSIDLLGNNETANTLTVIVDNTQPNTDVAVTGGPSYGNIDNGEINVTDTTQFTLTGTDDFGVGVDFEWWYINDPGNYSEVNPFTLAGLTLADGTYTMYYGSIDLLGNNETP
ncbi:MAG: hypothetical protein JSV56_13525, partial [Methanomassiliicoccales archaeon]